MKKVFLLIATTILNSSILILDSHAGGMMSNTNQNAAFIRNPARDGAIGIDGVYSNPAGVALMPEGWHMSLNWQLAWQRRIVDTQNSFFENDANNGGSDTKHYRGIATAPFIPSVQIAYNKDRFSFQISGAVSGGGGKCTFDGGLGSFDAAVGRVWAGMLSPVANNLNNLFSTFNLTARAPESTGYSSNGFLEGRQYYFGGTLGAAYKIVDKENLKVSGYAGVRFLYGMAGYKAEITDIKVQTAQGAQSLSEHINSISNSIYQAGVEAAMRYATTGDARDKMALDMVTQAGQNLSEQSGELAKYYNGVVLQSDQNGFGVCPIIGLDAKYHWVNFAFKFEFRTKMNMTNSSTVKEASNLTAVNQFVDGTSVREDTPALLTLGLELEPLKGLRFDVGYHHFYDRQAKKTYFYSVNDAAGNSVTVRSDEKNQLLSKGTDEWLAGVEYDFGKDKRWTVSGGIQTTNYGNTDEYMSDISFVTNSWSFGTGVKYKINDKMAVNVGYFQTNYRDYNQAADYRDAAGSNNQFTRRNRVFAAGLDIDF